MWRHFVAMGDSFTEGIGDPVDGIMLHGWVPNFVAALRRDSIGLHYTNLAYRGLTISEIREQQLAKAVKLQPDLVSVIAGANDILKGQWNAQNFETELTTMFEQLLAAKAVVLTATINNMAFLPISPKAKERVTAQLEEANTIIRSLATHYNIAYAETWNEPDTFEPRFWSADNLHPNAYGYTKVAEKMLEALSQQLILADIA